MDLSIHSMNCIRMELNEKRTNQREMVWSGKERERDGGQMQVAEKESPEELENIREKLVGENSNRPPLLNGASIPYDI